ncbi:DnaJ domain-containing protein [Hymenobacter sp. BT188]|uniref:iron-sulfur cluster co-chaperone HscB C-terminal domain-containing protein n=1 Tax=Hymenobacter sp. BT188 TaxID=2763504 RepID=UPI001651021B|nr:iron-sulfur cluster co-chaperone HscB C-terminal domain-containing protein [Hymenobacter sp. BT188]MBC6607352.1 DnaJ domain-containing protein [Hymenobacter sp. BT188]
MTDYFEFYDLPESFQLDEATLKQKYYAFSREFHPDFHATAPAERQQEILHLATQNTNAYRTLSDPDQRMAYILGRHNLLEEGKQEIPSDFLMEVMELNEQLMEPDPNVVASVENEVNAIAATLDAGIEPVLIGYPGLPPDVRPQALQQVRTYYLKRRYLLRIRESLAKFATRS